MHPHDIGKKSTITGALQGGLIVMEVNDTQLIKYRGPGSVC